MKKYTIKVWQVNGNVDFHHLNFQKEPKITRFMINDQHGLVGWIFDNTYYHKNAIERIIIHEV